MSALSRPEAGSKPVYGMVLTIMCLVSTVGEGGEVVSWRTAQYLFSEDAASPDTLRIFESKDYHRKKVTVFHSWFLRACERRESAGSVPIGHYVLPPVCVQNGGP
ncbi:unnamed protein product [Merluccius merluccius]